MNKKIAFLIVLLVVALLAAFAFVPNAEAELNHPVSILVGTYDQHGTLWVSQEELPYAFKYGYGHLFQAAAVFDKESDCTRYGLKTCVGILGYAHGTEPGSEIDGFKVQPDPNYSGAFLYYVEYPEKIEPIISISH